MTGVLAIQCNVQTSFAARQKLLVSFDRFQEPIEPVDQLEGGAWRLYTSSAVKLDVPKRTGAAKTKSVPAQRSTRLAARAGQRAGGLSRGGMASFGRHPGRQTVLGRVRGAAAVVCERWFNERSVPCMDGICSVPRARRAHNGPDGDAGKQRAAGGLDVCVTRGRI
jgi:hypothetical protein